jgi:hypothetical protein
VLLACSAPASAQYFGRNKVQYEDFDFRVLATPHFDVYYYEAEREAAEHAARMAERWYRQLSTKLDHELSERPPIVLYASHAHFVQTTVAPGLLPEGVGGFTDHEKGRVVLPFTPGLKETDHVLGHELVHAFQRDMLMQQGRSLAALPLWFTEGMAEHLTFGELDANTRMWIRDAIATNRLPRIEQLTDPRWFPYRYGQALWAFLVSRYGDELPARTLKSRARRGAVGRLAATTGADIASLTREWHAAMKRTLMPGPSASPNRSAEPRPLVDRRTGGRLNVGPSISPDGRHIVFLSERDQYSIDVFLADGQSGVVLRKLVTMAGSGRFDSLQFFESAGAWDPTGTRFALAARQDGRPVLSVFSMPEGATAAEHAVAGLDHVYDPTWSPDGRQLAFSALHRGRSDLFVIDLADGGLRQLTDDAFADLQPAWSPDGRTLAFVTDRFTASLDALTFGEYRLASLDIASSAIHELPSVYGAKNIDPQWADATHVYFVADPGGVSNVFRASVASGDIEQITDVSTGVSGMTALSPALSLAPAAERMVFSVYREGGYEIRSMPLANGREFTSNRDSRVHASAFPAAPGGERFEARPYRPVLTLDRVSQPYLSAGGGGLGGFFRAGVAFSFSDLLEQQEVQTAVQVGTRLQDFAVQSAYVNRRSRWTWGFAGAQLPAAFGRSRTWFGAEDEPAMREWTTLRQTHRQATVMAAYPFSRARRVEFSGGFHGVTFSREVLTRLYSRDTGKLLAERKAAAVTAAPAVALFETAAALVHDTSVHGPTGPVLGGRSRVEVAPTLGDLSFVTVTADHRRYFMPLRPLTLALRIQHVGRYGSDSSDARLLPLVWTLRNLVRGYSAREAAPDACVDPDGTCQALGEFNARQFLIANLEWRVPLLGPLGHVSRAAALPLDALVFADVGTFWSRAFSDAPPTVRTLRSVGAGVRLNAGGFVLEVAAARPFDRPRGGWALALSFWPAF